MPFNINDFRTNLVGDGARPNLFEVQLQFPAFVQSAASATSKSRFLVNSAQLPGSTVGLVPLYYFGREAKLAGNRTYADWTVQIINDEDMVIRNAFEQWINGINDPIGNVRSPSADVLDGGYGADAVVTHFNKEGTPIKQYNIVGMFPVDVSPIEVNWGSNDTIEEFSVTLAFQYWIDPGKPVV